MRDMDPAIIPMGIEFFMTPPAAKTRLPRTPAVVKCNHDEAGEVTRHEIFFPTTIWRSCCSAAPNVVHHQIGLVDGRGHNNFPTLRDLDGVQHEFQYVRQALALRYLGPDRAASNPIKPLGISFPYTWCTSDQEYNSNFQYHGSRLAKIRQSLTGTCYRDVRARHFII